MKQEEAIISVLSRSLIRLAWKFGPQGLDGECCGALTMPEFIALEKISATLDCSVQGAGQPLGFTKSGATRIVNRLESKGYVEKIRSEADSRICCVKLTGKGVEMLQSANSHYEKEFAGLTARLSGCSSDEAAALIIALARSIDS